jgi:hypothetical protein
MGVGMLPVLALYSSKVKDDASDKIKGPNSISNPNKKLLASSPPFDHQINDFGFIESLESVDAYAASSICSALTKT